MDHKPLNGYHILSLAINLPGCLMASRLGAMGAQVVKIEPATGDPLEGMCLEWYRRLSKGIDIQRWNIKVSAGRILLEKYLASSDLLLTTMRPAALERLGLTWEGLHEQFPDLCQVAIVGYASPDQDRPGHDLTYQAELGLLNPPDMPNTLLADLAGVEKGVLACLELLLARERGLGSGYKEISFVKAAKDFAEPLAYGLTEAGGLFAGHLPGYNLYRAKDGWIAVAALESSFWERLAKSLEIDPASGTVYDLRMLFVKKTAQFWETWARERDLPLVQVRKKIVMN